MKFIILTEKYRVDSATQLPKNDLTAFGFHRDHPQTWEVSFEISSLNDGGKGLRFHVSIGNLFKCVNPISRIVSYFER